MRRMKLVGLMAIAMLALAAVGSTSAFANENPTFGVGSTEAFGSAEIEATAAAEPNNVQKLKAPGVTIDCTGVTAGSGKIFAGEPGTDEETLTYTGCTVEKHEATCEVHSPGEANHTIKTNLLKSKLAFKTKASAKSKTAANSGTVTVFTPAAGETGTFVDVELSGTCGFVPSNNEVKGGVVVENVLGSTECEASKAETHELNSTGEVEYFTNPGEVKHTAKLTAFGLKAEYIGKDVVSLKDDEANEEEPEDLDDFWWICN